MKNKSKSNSLNDHQAHTLSKTSSQGSTSRKKVSGTSLDNNATSSSSGGVVNWRDFFDHGELEKIMIPEEENEDDDASEENGDKDSGNDEKGGSDSDPSEDNIDAGEFLEMIESAFKDDEDVSFKELKIVNETPKAVAMVVEKLAEVK
jgi:hypothetical protein